MIRSYLRRVTLGLAAAWLAGRYWQSSLTLGTGIRSRAALGDGVRRNSVATIIFYYYPFTCWPRIFVSPVPSGLADARCQPGLAL